MQWNPMETRMSAYVQKLPRRLGSIGAAVALVGVVSALTAQWAYGAQPAKGNRLVAHHAKEVRNYDRPRQEGNRIAFCLPANGECGKPAADAFCRGKEFEGALTFQRERMEGHGAQMRFLRIKCWRTQGAAVPEVTAARDVITNTSAKSNRMRSGGHGDWK
jgi:hypothetical protein